MTVVLLCGGGDGSASGGWSVGGGGIWVLQLRLLMAMRVMWCLLILSVLHDGNCVVDGGGERASTDGRLHPT